MLLGACTDADSCICFCVSIINIAVYTQEHICVHIEQTLGRSCERTSKLLFAPRAGASARRARTQIQPQMARVVAAGSQARQAPGEGIASTNPNVAQIRQ